MLVRAFATTTWRASLLAPRLLRMNVRTLNAMGMLPHHFFTRFAMADQQMALLPKRQASRANNQGSEPKRRKPMNVPHNAHTVIRMSAREETSRRFASFCTLIPAPKGMLLLD